jgi:serine protease inhibitor
MAALNEHVTGENHAAEQSIRKEIIEFREAFQAAQSNTKRIKTKRKWREYHEALETEKQIAAKLNRALAKVDQYEFRIANALWGEKTYPILDAYIKTIKNFYKTGGLFPADFKNNFPTERIRLNDWVAEQTERRIKDIIPDLPPDEAKLIRLILTNAIYFKGEWSEPFNEADTKPRDFIRSDGSIIRTPMMSAQNLEVGRYAAFNSDASFFDTPRQIQQGRRNGLYPGDDGFAMLELPYKGDDLVMVLIAPNSAAGLAQIEKMISPETLKEWIGMLVKRKVHVFMPKFKLETKCQMKQTLRNIGMVRAFIDPSRSKGADFTGMCASPDPMLRLYITQVFHKAFVEVNEKGTEAAAATAVLMARTTSIPVMVPFTPTFNADRPFLFLIRERNTGSILFMGRFINPNE